MRKGGGEESVGFSHQAATGDCSKARVQITVGTQDILSRAFQPRPVQQFD